MSSTRFPKQAYVRRLERVYDDLTDWPDIERISAVHSLDWPQQGRYEARDAVLAEAQRRIEQAVDMLLGMPRVS